MHFGIVEQFAVEDDGDGAVLVVDRLPAVRQADDAEPAIGEADAVVLEEAVLIGAAMEMAAAIAASTPGHGSTAGKIHHPGYSTHGVNPR